MQTIKPVNTFPEDSENFVVSACLAGEAWRGIGLGLEPKHFSSGVLSLIYETIIKMEADGIPIDIITVSKRLTGIEPHEIVRISNLHYSYTNLEHHVKNVLNGSYLRELKSFTSEVQDEIESVQDVEAYIDQVETSIYDMKAKRVEEKQGRGEILTELMTDFERSLKDGFKPQGITTGFPIFDKQINGLEGGKLYIVAARPSMGKTSLLRNIVQHVSVDLKKPSLVVSAEMTEKELLKCFVFAEAGISIAELIETGAKPTKGQLVKLGEAVKLFNSAPIEIFDKSQPSLAEIRAKARKMKHDGGIGLIAVDYIQLLTSGSSSYSRENEVMKISQSLKAMSKDFDCPVLCLAQLNRGPEQRTGESYGIPRMSDLRESGAIEQDADVVGLLYRKGYYNKEDDSLRNHATLLIEKNRSGSTGPLELSWSPELMRFSESAGDSWLE